MKKIGMTIVAVSLLTGALYAEGMNNMKGHNSSMMNQEECSVMHKNFHQQSKKVSKVKSVSQDAFASFYPPEDID